VTDDDVTRLDAPNQQVVRPDGSGPADEGSGGAAKPKRGPGRPAGARSAPKPDSPDDDGNDG
jgi:hypothetical protein